MHTPGLRYNSLGLLGQKFCFVLHLSIKCNYQNGRFIFSQKSQFTRWKMTPKSESHYIIFKCASTTRTCTIVIPSLYWGNPPDRTCGDKSHFVLQGIHHLETCKFQGMIYLYEYHFYHEKRHFSISFLSCIVRVSKVWRSHLTILIIIILKYYYYYEVRDRLDFHCCCFLVSMPDYCILNGQASIQITHLWKQWMRWAPIPAPFLHVLP